ncbi:MAG TPA: cob(I)yrinic acid a,c-diamide adenosyltransferase [Patescibacteria group bacterium]|nr:cob(I)yrinic acid a,c-diamide adenosyltransferase [Patescibacteria group bacterium]
MSPIYTKTGDEGKTSLLSGERVTKDCISLQTVGDVDELNAVLGVAVAQMQKLETENEFLKELRLYMQDVQRDLFKVGAELVSLQSELLKSGNIKVIGILQVETMEKKIDAMWGEMTPLKNFILPGGSLLGAYLHEARTICRRTERELVALGKEKDVRPELYKYLNRLSDFLFATARWVNFKLGEEEIIV